MKERKRIEYQKIQISRKLCKNNGEKYSLITLDYNSATAHLLMKKLREEYH